MADVTPASVERPRKPRHEWPVELLRPACPDDLKPRDEHATGEHQYPLGHGSAIRDHAARPTPALDLLAEALTLIPDLPDDVRDQLTARREPPSPSGWCTYPGDVTAHVLTGTPQGPTWDMEARTAVTATHDPATDTTRVGWTHLRLDAVQADVVLTRAREAVPCG